MDIFQKGEREVVETVCLVIFPLISLMKDQVFSLSEKGVKAVVLGPGSSHTETKDPSEGKKQPCIYKVSAPQVGLNSDRGYEQYYFKV